MSTPPSSAVIWGEVLIYATALGIADKVEKHLSELDAFIVKRVKNLEKVRMSSYIFYSSAISLTNLAKHGNRSGPISKGGGGRSHGGFSSRSSGGWSSGGGGGFSSRSSGCGGFR